MAIDWDLLKADMEYHLRPKSLFQTSDGRFMAIGLGYISRQDVQRRLDEACGPGNWSVEFEVVEPTTPIIKCNLTLVDYVEDKDVGSSDETSYSVTRKTSDSVFFEDMGGPQEGQTDKGDRFKAACSDAFKRAATHAGVGRFLYDLDASRRECDAYRRQDGKIVFKGWKDEAKGPSKAGDAEEVGYDSPAPTPAPTHAPPAPAPGPAPGMSPGLKAIPGGGTDSSQYPGGPFACRFCKQTNTYVKTTSGKGSAAAHDAVWCRNLSCEAVTNKYSYSYPLHEAGRWNEGVDSADPPDPREDDLPF